MPSTNVRPLDASPFLSVNDLTLQYKTDSHLVTATDRVSFDVRQSERLVLLGPSGCGKSTILKAIGGFIRPASGSVQLLGQTITKPGVDRGLVFQEFDQLLPWKTALENVVFAITSTRKLDKETARETARYWLAKVNLAGFEHSYPHQLSGGMKMRVAIARCLALDAKIILMDEPFASLDAMTRQKMQQELLQLWRETQCTLLFVTHSIDEAIVLGSRILMFSPHPGRLVEQVEVGNTELARTDARFIALRKHINDVVFQHQPQQAVSAA